MLLQHILHQFSLYPSIFLLLINIDYLYSQLQLK